MPESEYPGDYPNQYLPIWGHFIRLPHPPYYNFHVTKDWVNKVCYEIPEKGAIYTLTLTPQQAVERFPPEDFEIFEHMVHLWNSNTKQYDTPYVTYDVRNRCLPGVVPPKRDKVIIKWKWKTKQLPPILQVLQHIIMKTYRIRSTIKEPALPCKCPPCEAEIDCEELCDTMYPTPSGEGAMGFGVPPKEHCLAVCESKKTTAIIYDTDTQEQTGDAYG